MSKMISNNSQHDNNLISTLKYIDINTPTIHDLKPQWLMKEQEYTNKINEINTKWNNEYNEAMNTIKNVTEELRLLTIEKNNMYDEYVQINDSYKILENQSKSLLNNTTDIYLNQIHSLQIKIKNLENELLLYQTNNNSIPSNGNSNGNSTSTSTSISPTKTDLNRKINSLENEKLQLICKLDEAEKMIIKLKNTSYNDRMALMKSCKVTSITSSNNNINYYNRENSVVSNINNTINSINNNRENKDNLNETNIIK
jgi:hypothetical protein